MTLFLREVMYVITAEQYLGDELKSLSPPLATRRGQSGFRKRQIRVAWRSDQDVANALSAALLRITSVGPFNCAIC